MRKNWLAVLALVMAVVLAGLMPVCAGADTTIAMQVEGTYGQTVARGMLNLINEFRTGDNAWYWNKTNTAKVKCIGLQPLVYDYDLEEMAMQRAIELAVSFSHTRPDGTKCWTATPVSGYSAQGENIAYGFTTASSVETAWEEADKYHDGQGHRRNLLGIDDDGADFQFNRVGIGHVVVNGVHYWVQEFGRSTNSIIKTPALDGKAVREFNASVSKIQSITAEKVQVTYGRATNLPEVTLQVGSITVTADPDELTWESETTDIVEIRNGKVVGVAAGTGWLMTTVAGKVVEAEVTVNPKSIADATVTLSKTSYSYNGLAQTPGATVADGKTELTEGKDYTLSYSDNKNASGKAKAIVTGKGNYTGTVSATFTISKAPLVIKAKDWTITYGDKPANNGATFTGLVAEETESDLDGELAFSYDYKQYDDVGEYTITPGGLTSGNYQITWTDGALTVEQKKVSVAWEKTVLPYTGDKQAPKATLSGVVNDDDVAATVEGGESDIGSYTAKATGLSGKKAKNYNLPETVSVEYEIEKGIPKVTAPAAKKGLVYTGKAQELITAGTASGGTLVYSLEKDGTYKEAIPTATEDGSYTVWYKALGDKLHYDTEPESVTTVIADKVTAFVTRCYELILNRAPDADGLRSWVRTLTEKTATAAQIIDGFVRSDEYTNRKLSNGQSVDILYRTMLNREADAGGRAGWVTALSQGYSLQNIIDGFCGSDEFTGLCREYGIEAGSVGAPSPASPDTPRGKIEAFVKRCYKLILNRDADQAGLTAWSDALEARTAPAAQIIDGFVRSPEYINRRLTDGESVDILYRTMLDRAADADGKAGWVTALSQGYTLQHIINGFCGSAEFTNICNNFGIVAGNIAVGGTMVMREAITPEGDEAEAPVVYQGYNSEFINEEKIRAFVEHCYVAVFGREGDAEGIENYTALILDGKKTPKKVAYEFIFSSEFQEKLPGNEEFIRILYRLYFDREPGADELAGWVKMFEDGASLEEIVNGFAASAEFKAIVNQMK